MKYFSNKNLDDKIKKGGGGGGETYTADEDTLHLGDGNEFSISDSWKGKINLGVTAYGKIYFQPNANLSSLVEPIAAFDYLGSKKGLIFESVAESEVEDSPAHLMLRNFGTAETPNYALYTPYAIISKGDQIVGSGTPGGGGGGDSKYLNDLLDVTITNPSNGQALVYQNGEWVNGSAIPDLSNYYTKAQTDIAISSAITALNLGAAATYGVTTSISSSSDNLHLATGKAVYDYVALAVTSALKYRGITTTDIKNNPTQNPIIIGGDSYSAVSGDVVLMSGSSKEYLWNGTSWQELGDESSYVLKTQTVNGYALSGNITLDISDIIGNAAVGSISKPIYYTGSAFNDITDLDLLSEAAGHGYVKAKRFVLFSQGNTEVYFEWVPGENGDPGYVQLNSAFLTQGDQIVGSGTPGGSDPGGAHYLKDLLDVSLPTDSRQIGDGQVLMWDATNQVWKNGTVQSSGGSVTSVGLSMPTGFSVASSPVTSSGTLAVSFSNGYSLPTTAKQTNWDAAYGWGNHANAGYLLASDAASTYQPIIPANTYHPYGGGNIDFEAKAVTTTGNITLQAADRSILMGAEGSEAIVLRRNASYLMLGSGTYQTQATIIYGTPIRFYTHNGTAQVEGMRILANGRVAVNSTTSSYQLYVNGTLGVSGLSTLTGGATIPATASLKIGDATITWVPPADASTPGYLKINSALLTEGDQIVGSGTPGGGGTGGQNYLKDLYDVSGSVTAKPSADSLLVYSTTGTDKNGGSGAWEYNTLNVATNKLINSLTIGTSTPVDDDYYVSQYANGGTTTTTYHRRKVSVLYTYIKNKLAADNIYLPLTAGASNPLTGILSITNSAVYSLYLSNTTSGATQVGIRFRLGGTTNVGALYCNSSGEFYNASNKKFLTEGNFVAGTDYVAPQTTIAGYGITDAYISSSAVTIGTDTVGSSAAPIGYATQATRLKGYVGTAAAGGYDLNTMLSGGGITSQYSAGTYWANGPTGMSYGGVAQFNTQSTDTLSLQLAWDVTHNVEDGTNRLWWRDRNNLGWGGWRQIWHSGNSNKSDVAWTCSTLTSSVATGTAPLTVASTTMVDNLNANYLDGWPKEYFVPGYLYNAANGYLVKTRFNDAIRYVYIKIEGTAYNYANIYSLATVYTNQTAATNTAFAYPTVTHLGRTKINNLQAFLYGGYLYIWFQQPRTYCAMKVTVWAHGVAQNYVDTITNAAIPTSGVTCLTSFTEYQGAFTDSNVASATKLQTARTIWGQSFDGTANVSGALTGATSILIHGAARNDPGGTITFQSTSAAEGGVQIAAVSGGGGYSHQALVFNVSNDSAWTQTWSEAMRITPAGNVGIGTASPSCKLNIVGGSGWTEVINSTNTQVALCHGSGYGIFAGSMQSSSSYYLLDLRYGQTTLGSGGTSALYVRTDGNVGVGTTSPDSLLYVNGLTKIIEPTSARFSITMNSPNITLSNISSAYSSGGWTAGLLAGTDGTTAGCIAGVYMSGSTIQRYWYGGTTYSNPLMVILPGGNVGIGTTAPGYKLDVIGSVSCRSIYVNQSSSATATGVGLWGTSSPGTYGIYMATTANYGTHGGVTSSGAYATYFQMNGTAGRGWIWRAASKNVASINTVGLFTTNGDQVISSDERLKTHIEPVKLTVEQIAGMRAVTYDRKDSGLHSLGVIAQDWEKVLPESVNQGEYLTFKYAQTAMVSAIILAKHETEQDKEIRKLKARVRELEKQLQMRS